MSRIVRVWVVVGLTLLIGTAPTFAEQRGVKVEGKDPADYIAAQAGKSWAVVIGIDDYEHAPRLHYAVADAKAVAKTLRQRGFQVRELYDQQATAPPLGRGLCAAGSTRHGWVGRCAAVPARAWPGLGPVPGPWPGSTAPDSSRRPRDPAPLPTNADTLWPSSAPPGAAVSHARVLHFIVELGDPIFSKLV